MTSHTRRQFVRQAGVAGAASLGVLADAAPAAEQSRHCVSTGAVSLDGVWQFRLDPRGKGEAEGLPNALAESKDWKSITVPHTWQTSPDTAEYHGAAWYRRAFDAPAGWAGKTVRVEFEAAYHCATVWLNGKPVGEHARKGYTAFVLDLTGALRPGQPNVLIVRVENPFDPNMLPRGNSYDWTPDGGLTRPVRLLVTPKVFIERIEVDAKPLADFSSAILGVRVFVRNSGANAAECKVALDVFEEDTGRRVLKQVFSEPVRIQPGRRERVAAPDGTLVGPRLWHFDHPNLYRIEVRLDQDGRATHEYSDTFGVRRFEVKGGGFYLNGERVRLMGVERMAGSHPDYGMAEPESWIVHDHDDMKELNCVFTRVHWQQDQRVLDYCDRHGILIQLEVPTWGAATFEGMEREPSPEIMQNGLEQLREMIARDRNHPSVFAWGLCNEVNGQNPPAQVFVRRMAEEARKLDPSRPLTYASNSLHQTPGRDIAGVLDFISWNEYYESWYKGDVPTMERNLEEIHSAFPGKPVIISEYGYCECAPGHTAGDTGRIRVLREHNAVFRRHDFVGGLIFFCYNDYRTHIGDKGLGVLKQRVHGVVDLYGERKPSFEELRRESSPVEELRVGRRSNGLEATVVTRKTLPAYTLRGYKLRWIVYGAGDLPMEQHEANLDDLAPGTRATVALRFEEKAPKRVRVDLVRPMGFSALTAWWRP